MAYAPNPDELPGWLYAASDEAVQKRDAWRELVAADKARIAPLRDLHDTLGANIVAKTTVTGTPGNPGERVPKAGVTHEEVDALLRRRRELTAGMRPDPAIARAEAELRALRDKVADEVDVRAMSAEAVRRAHARIVAAIAEARAAMKDRDESVATWQHFAGGGVYTVGGTSWDLRAFEISEVEDFRSGALTDGLDSEVAK